MQLKQSATIFGYIFMSLGVLGFVPGITSEGELLGIFEVNGVQNLVYILSGILAIMMAKTENSAQSYFMAMGCLYGLLALVGFVQGDTVFGILSVNMATNLLHAAMAVSMLSLGFGSTKSSTHVKQAS